MHRSSASFSFGESPLTDVRSVGSSALFHALLVLVASLAVFNVVQPATDPSSRPPIRAEFDPVDNRADHADVPGEGGGSAGEIGGLSRLPAIAPDNRADSTMASQDPAADALLQEILPSSNVQSAPALVRALPGPQVTGQGLIPGSGTGGGGGSGGGSGGGVGRAIGPGTQFFG